MPRYAPERTGAPLNRRFADGTPLLRSAVGACPQDRASAERRAGIREPRRRRGQAREHEGRGGAAGEGDRYRPRDDLPAEEGTALDRFAELYAVVGDRERSLASYEARVSVAQRSGDQRGLAMGSGNLGIAYYEAERLQSALTNLHTAARLFEAHRMLPELAKAYSYIGACYIGVRDADRGISAYSKHIDACREIGDSQSAALSMVNLSSLLDMTRRTRPGNRHRTRQLMQRLAMPQARELCARVATLRSARQG
jgi:tetratricopeptide (TPR) repeat protein